MTRKINHSAIIERALAAIKASGPLEAMPWAAKAHIEQGTLRAYIPQLQRDGKIHIAQLIKAGAGWPIRVYAFGPGAEDYTPIIRKRRVKPVFTMPTIPRPDMLTAALMGMHA